MEAPLRTRLNAKEAVRIFKELAFVEMDLPDDLPFRDLDLEDPNMTAVYAKIENFDMSVIAAKGAPTQEDVLQFVRSQNTGIPNLDKMGIQIKKDPQSVPANSGSGMRNGSLWTGTYVNGEPVHIAVIPRLDNKGAYMVVVSGSEGGLETHDDMFESVYKSMRAQPLP